MDERSTSSRLRQLISAGCVAMPGVFNAAMGRMVERAGFDAVYISGAGLCNATAGVPDIGLLTLTEVAQLAGYIARAAARGLHGGGGKDSVICGGGSWIGGGGEGAKTDGGF